MTYLLDTNVVSELRRKEKCHPSVRDWQEAHDPRDCGISVICLMELKLGLALAAKRDALQAQVLETWYETRVKPGFAGRILPVTPAVAEACASLHASRPRPFRDSLIAATALVHGLEVVTRNVEDFANTGVTVINPWHPR